MQCSWGVDISDGALTAVRLTRQRGRFQVLESHVLATSGPGEWTTEPRASLGDLQREGIMRFLREVRPSPRDLLCVGYPGLAVFQRVLSLPPLPEDRVGETIAFELKQLRPFATDDVFLRRRVLEHAGRTAELRTLVVATPREQLLAIAEDLRKLGLRADLIEPETIALANYLDWERPLSLPFMALQVGRLRTDAVLLAPHFVFTRVFPYGAGGLLKEDPEPETAVRLARRLAKDSRAAIAAAFGDAQAFAGERVLLLGTGAANEDLATQLEQQLGLPVQLMTGARRLHVHPRLERNPSMNQVATLGSAIGLALAGLNAGQFSLPLVPISDARRARDLAPMTSAAALAASALLVGLTYFEVRQRDVYQAALATANDADHDSLQQQVAAIEARTRTIERQVAELHRAALLPTTMLAQTQALIEAVARDLPECRVKRFAVRREATSAEITGVAHCELVSSTVDDIDQKLLRVATTIGLAAPKITRPTATLELVLEWHAEVRS